jgi:hypothetical protein
MGAENNTVVETAMAQLQGLEYIVVSGHEISLCDDKR